MDKKEIYIKISRQTGVSVAWIEKTINTFFSSKGLFRHLKNYNKVKLHGFGRFYPTLRTVNKKLIDNNYKRVNVRHKVKKFLEYDDNSVHRYLLQTKLPKRNGKVSK